MRPQLYLLFLPILLIGTFIQAQDLIVLVSKDTIYARDIEITRNYINYFPFHEKARDMYSFKRENVETIYFVDGRVGTNKNNYFSSSLDYPKAARLEHIRSGELIQFRPGDYISYRMLDSTRRSTGEITDVSEASIFIDGNEIPYKQIERIGMFVPNPALRKIAGGGLIVVGAVGAGIGAISTLVGMNSLLTNDGPVYFVGGIAGMGLGVWGVSKGVGMIIRSSMVNLHKGKWALITDV